MRRIVIGFAALVCILGLGMTAFAQDMGRYLVTVKGPLDEAVAKAGGRMVHQYHIVPGVAIEVPKAAVEGLRRNPNVVSIEPDVTVKALDKGGIKPPKPPKGGGTEQSSEVLEWNVDRIDADLAWGESTGSGVTVAVVDTGIDKYHPDLADNILGGLNFVYKGRKLTPSKWDDDNGHGTHVAGIIAATDNEIGVIGVAPEAKLYAVKVLDASGSGWLSDVVAAVELCVDDQMDVVNMSLGTTYDYPLLEQACQVAAEAGILLVAAAGNEGADVLYPAAYSSVIAVGATYDSDDVPSWSNQGPELELAAPGVAVRSTWKGGGYRTVSGTSMAAPHVAGVCALARGVPVPGTADDIRSDLQDTADDLCEAGRDETSGFGLVDAEEAVTGIQTNP